MKFQIIDQDGVYQVKEADAFELQGNCLKLYRDTKTSGIIETPDRRELIGAYWGIKGFERIVGDK